MWSLCTIQKALSLEEMFFEDPMRKLRFYLCVSPLIYWWLLIFSNTSRFQWGELRSYHGLSVLTHILDWKFIRIWISCQNIRIENHHYIDTEYPLKFFYMWHLRIFMRMKSSYQLWFLKSQMPWNQHAYLSYFHTCTLYCRIGKLTMQMAIQNFSTNSCKSIKLICSTCIWSSYLGD